MSANYAHPASCIDDDPEFVKAHPKSWTAHADPNRSDVAAINSADEVMSTLLGMTGAGAAAGRLARGLHDRFGSFAAILAASDVSLRDALEGRESSLVLIRVLKRAITLVLREPLEDRPAFNCWSALETYLKFSLMSEVTPSVRLLLLDGGGRLLVDEQHASGRGSHLRLNPRAIVTRALETLSAGIIVVQCSPGAAAHISEEHVRAMGGLGFVLTELGVRLVDCVVVGGNGCVSMAAAGLLHVGRASDV